MAKLFNSFRAALQRKSDRARPELDQDVVCANTGRGAVYQRTRDDCLICALAMFTGRSYGEVVAQALALAPAFPPGGPMSHSMMRGVAHAWGVALVSSIYMDWSKPAIIGVLSPVANGGHAVFWDGQKLIDPGTSELVDRDYVERNGVEFTQRASDIRAIIEHDLLAATGCVSVDELLC
jgi:hypothetical protein